MKVIRQQSSNNWNGCYIMLSIQNRSSIKTQLYSTLHTNILQLDTSKEKHSKILQLDTSKEKHSKILQQ